MPRDANGKPIEVGDEVTVICKVMDVGRGEAADLVTLQVADAPGAVGSRRSLILCHSKQTTRVEEGRP